MGKPHEILQQGYVTHAGGKNRNSRALKKVTFKFAI